MSLILEGTAACLIRDTLIKAWFQKKITLKEITDKLSQMPLSKLLQSQILDMVNYKQYDRITCPVEKAMESAVYFHVIRTII